MFKVLGLLSILMVTITSVASPKKVDSKYNIESVEVQELTNAETQYQYMNLADQYQYIGPQQYKSLNLIGSIDKIVKIGKTVWSVIEKNRPVVNLKLDHVSVVPKSAKHVGTLNNWSSPDVRTYKVVYKNGFGSNVVEFIYRTVFTHSGQFNGKGAYIANASIYPAHLEVSWGYTFNAKSFAPKAVNIGTAENPVAGLEMHLNWKVDTPLKSSQNTVSMFITGTGETSIFQ